MHIDSLSISNVFILGHSSIVQGLPDVTVEENHGGVKRLKRTRYRHMPVSWIDLDHRKPSIRVVGKYRT